MSRKSLTFYKLFLNGELGIINGGYVENFAIDFSHLFHIFYIFANFHFK
jgi:hypothetical protein